MENINSTLDEIQFSLRKLHVKVEQMYEILDFVRLRIDAPKIDAFYDLSQLCRMLDVSKRTVQRFRTSGRLKYFIVSGRTCYPKADTDIFVEKYLSGSKTSQNVGKLKK